MITAVCWHPGFHDPLFKLEVRRERERQPGVQPGLHQPGGNRLPGSTLTSHWALKSNLIYFNSSPVFVSSSVFTNLGPATELAPCALLQRLPTKSILNNNRYLPSSCDVFLATFLACQGNYEQIFSSLCIVVRNLAVTKEKIKGLWCFLSQGQLVGSIIIVFFAFLLILIRLIFRV